MLEMDQKQRYILEIAYNGAAYSGWQKQDNANSVQEELNHAIKKLLNEEVRSSGCGRTDTGVHARQFFMQFDSIKSPDETFVKRLNYILPRDILVKRLLKPARADVHVRYSATSRTYHYIISTVKNPFLIDRATFFYHALDVATMNEASALLLEYEDFQSFSKKGTDVKHYLCKLTEAKWKQNGELLVFRISANRFLRSMVRLLTGTLIMVGSGRIDIDRFREIIESKNPLLSSKAAPADGLYLTNVRYPENSFAEWPEK
jgi:tRNA pseudouridine38-40 synthase